jgi:hypothetical protein
MYNHCGSDVKRSFVLKYLKRKSPIKSMSRQFFSLAAILGLAGSAALAQAQPTNLDLRAYAHCSEEKPGTPLLDLSWNVQPGAQETALKDQRLDATVYRNGFNLGRFVSLLPVTAERSFENVANKVPTAELPLALNLRAVAVQLVQPATPPAAQKQQLRVTVRLEKANPGIDYSFRLMRQVGSNWVSMATVSSQAPTCPVDEVEP